MFTFGIFSTHLPYIAFVLFYGFFFLVGIEKASAGEMGEGEKLIPEVISVSIDNYTGIDDDNPYIFNAQSGNIGFKQMLLYGDIVNLYYISNRFIKTTDYRYSRFSRPPPVD
jgi:hypothetical protein